MNNGLVIQVELHSRKSGISFFKIYITFIVINASVAITTSLIVIIIILLLILSLLSCHFFA